MNHVEFWKQYTAKLGSLYGWTVFENGTLVHPYGNESAEEVMKELDKSLLGGSGAGSIFGDFQVTDVGEGHIVVGFNDLPILGHCERSELEGEPDGWVFYGGHLCRKRRNLDAKHRVAIFYSEKPIQ